MVDKYPVGVYYSVVDRYPYGVYIRWIMAAILWKYKGVEVYGE